MKGYMKQVNCDQCIWRNQCEDYDICDDFSPADDELDNYLTVERGRSEWRGAWNDVTGEYGDGGLKD